MSFSAKITLIVILFTFSGFSQTWVLPLTGKVEKNDKKLQGAVVMLLQGGKQIDQTMTGEDGSFKFDIPANGDFIVSVTKQGHCTKKFEVSTKGVPPDDKSTKRFDIPGISLFEPLPNIDYSLLNQPLVKIKYSSEKEMFDYDEVYFNQSLAALDKLKQLEEDVKNKQKEIEANYIEAIKNADKAFQKKEWILAKSTYKSASTIKPDEAYPKAQMAQIDAILKDQEALNAKAKAENEAKAKAEADKAKLDAEALAKSKAEADAKAKAEADRIAKEKADKAKLDAEALAKSKLDADAKAKAEADRLAKEKADKSKLDAEALAKSKAEADAKAKAEADRLAKEKIDAESKAGMLAKEKAERDQLDAKTKAEADAKAKLEANRLAKEKANAEAKAKAEAERQAKLGANKYKDEIKKGDEYFKNKKYLESKLAYENALIARAGDTYAKAKLIEIERIVKSDKATSESGDAKMKELMAKYPPGVTETTISGTGVVIIQRIVVKDSSAYTYHKKIFNWGGIAFFRDGASITESIFELETKP